MNSIPTSLSLSPPLATATAPLGRGPKAARDFEASLIGSLLESREKTFAALPGESTLSGTDEYNYRATRALAEGSGGARRLRYRRHDSEASASARR